MPGSNARTAFCRGVAQPRRPAVLLLGCALPETSLNTAESRSRRFRVYGFADEDGLGNYRSAFGLSFPVEPPLRVRFGLERRPLYRVEDPRSFQRNIHLVQVLGFYFGIPYCFQSQ